MIDFRSDVLTRPTEEMWAAMQQTQPGWVWSGQDATVNHLESTGAELLGTEEAMFVPTCTMANLLALMAQGRRGTQVILEESSHIAWSEEWGLSYICGLFPRLLPGKTAAPEIAAIEDALTTPQFGHLPQTSILCLENSHNNSGGAIVTPSATAAISALAHKHNVAVHLDGARLFNSAAALNVSPRQLVEPVDTVSISLNKGLGAPYGALLGGSAATIREARINLKRLGAGSVHKAGYFAAAATIALGTAIERAAHDNRNAARLARHLATIPGLGVDVASVKTNIVNVMVTAENCSARLFVEQAAKRGVLALERTPTLVRFVTHVGVSEPEIDSAAEVIAQLMRELG